MKIRNTGKWLAVILLAGLLSGGFHALFAGSSKAVSGKHRRDVILTEAASLLEIPLSAEFLLPPGTRDPFAEVVEVTIVSVEPVPPPPANAGDETAEAPLLEAGVVLRRMADKVRPRGIIIMDETKYLLLGNLDRVTVGEAIKEILDNRTYEVILREIILQEDTESSYTFEYGGEQLTRRF